MSLALPGEFPGWDDVEDGVRYAPAPIPGVPAGAMPELDFAGLVPQSALTEQIASVQSPTMRELMKDEG